MPCIRALMGKFWQIECRVKNFSFSTMGPWLLDPSSTFFWWFLSQDWWNQNGWLCSAAVAPAKSCPSWQSPLWQSELEVNWKTRVPKHFGSSHLHNRGSACVGGVILYLLSPWRLRWLNFQNGLSSVWLSPTSCDFRVVFGGLPVLAAGRHRRWPERSEATHFSGC